MSEETPDKTRRHRMKRARRGIIQAIQRLEDSMELGRVARKNARAAAFGAIRALTNAIDELYPVPVKPIPPSQKTLLHLSEVADEKEFKAELISIAPQTWDNVEVQAFAAWFLENHGEHARPVIVRPGHGKTWDDLGIYLYDAGRPLLTLNVPAIHVQLWETLRQMTRSPGAKNTERSRIRGLYKVAQAWSASEWREPLQEGEQSNGS